jgi:small subunit ribosomal protein S20
LFSGIGPEVYSIDRPGTNNENTRLFETGIDRVANTKSAAKRAKQSERRRQDNIAQKSRMRTAMKNVVNALNEGNESDARETYVVAVPKIDELARKGLIHKNKAARHKSRLNKAIKRLSTS